MSYRPSAEFEALSVGVRFDTAHTKDAKQLFANRPQRTLAQTDNEKTDETDLLRIAIPPPASLNLFKKSILETVDPTENNRDAEHQNLPLLHRPGPMAVRRILKEADVQSTSFDFIPVTEFAELRRPPFSVDEKFIENLRARDHVKLTPIQMVALPLLLTGRDVIACAPTGSGKTIAFLLPMFVRLRKPDRDATVRGIVLCPTKELAVQIEREALFLMKGARWRLVQHGQSTRGKDIMITTPARCVSLISQGLLDASKVEYIVFDEGDKLWDANTDNMKDIDTILAACTNPEKVISFFSATLSNKAERLARTVMHDAVRLIIKGRAEASTDVDHKLLFVGNEIGKIVAIRNMINEGIKPPILIFVQTIERTKELYDEIANAGLHVALLNSTMSAEERDATVLQFRMGQIWVLICTELMARGVDFKGVGTVVNFDIPLTVESYVHRCGRTGRAGKRGTAITFFTEEDRDRLLPIARLIHRSGSYVEPWILEKLKPVSRQQRKLLERSVPQRMVVSTRKRIMIGTKRIERQLTAVEKARQTKAARPEDLNDLPSDNSSDED